MSKSKDVMVAMMFYEGGCGPETEYVCRKDKYTKEQAIDEAIEESCDLYDFGTVEEIKEKINKFESDEFIAESYVRYYPRMPQGMEIESGWMHCNKAKGAVAVYDVLIEKIIEALDSL